MQTSGTGSPGNTDVAARSRDTPAKFLVGIGRGIGGALLFSLPMQMTMEMWELGFTMDRWRLVLLLLLAIPLLIGIAHRIGFEETFSWKDGARDAMIAYGIGIVTSAIMLSLFKLLMADMPAEEITGKIAVQAVPASIGALLGRSQLGSGKDDADDDPQAGYGSELFMMAVGALFLNLNLAPTEEMILISYKMTPWHAVATILFSIAVMHAFVYAVSFKGGHELSGDTPWWHALIRFTLPGYVIALIISLYSLWSFGRLDGGSFTPAMMAMIVLAFPGAVGAAAARLIL
ncbi:TIGR02587 family membrane protein [Pararhizobium sp. BT-229]|uniref:TIGR02587 family membrane protein n=1 Tax=Pararhizobium sp. BT-229 TaxID=2986923 RepID=UPI0021F730F1|nr:TIGR02587 family membrane protein [Pararhizobium sp. BT-229]MCV9962924.1 TIGR02587 family membrane protein [Pararhizobium sp. BT-229]